MQEPNEERKPLDIALSAVHQAVEEWKAKCDPEEVKKQVFARLDEKRDEIVLKLLGFTDSWGRWELDRCNGRDNSSIAGSYLHQAAQDAIRAWLEQVPIPLLNTAKGKSIQKVFGRAYLKYLERAAYEMGQKRAQQDLEKVFKSILVSEDLEGLMKLRDLIHANQQPK
jgi:hypothetical protein